MSKFEKLVQIMQQLRDPEKGCPWDIQQTHQSLKKYLLEETYEAVDAIDENDMPSLREELGDVLLQVVFHAQIASEQEDFDVEEIIDGLCNKLTQRHPHVFEKQTQLTPDQVQDQWQAIKAQTKHEPSSLLSSIPKSMPALLKADLMGKKMAKVGFDWQSASQIKGKMDEEWCELEQGIANQDPENIEEELGDFLFVTAQYIRKMGLDPERTLQKANAKFQRRIEEMENIAKGSQRSLKDYSLDQLEDLWQQAKKNTQRV